MCHPPNGRCSTPAPWGFLVVCDPQAPVGDKEEGLLSGGRPGRDPVGQSQGTGARSAFSDAVSSGSPSHLVGCVLCCWASV